MLSAATKSSTSQKYEIAGFLTPDTPGDDAARSRFRKEALAFSCLHQERLEIALRPIDCRIETASISLKLLECLASTGVNTPETMLPSPELSYRASGEAA